MWTDIIYIFGKELHQPYSEVMSMPMYQIFFLLEKWNEEVKERNKQNKEENKSYERDMATMKSNQSQMMNNMNHNFNSSSLPKI